MEEMRQHAGLQKNNFIYKNTVTYNYSKEYEQLKNIYKKLHKEGTSLESAENIFDGKSLKFFFKAIKQVITITNSKSIIDFGCGKAKYYFEEVLIENKKYHNIQSYWDIDNITLYDPGYRKFQTYPNKILDGVICVDVVEHIPEADVEKFIEEIFSLATKFVFIVIACYPAKKYLPDGRNVHLSIKKPEEWQRIISKVKKIHPTINPFVICSETRKKFVTVS